MPRKARTILGVAPDAGPSEWKRAYRRLAMRWHPDRSDHPEATERFKQISAAYEKLLSTVDLPEIEENPASTAKNPPSRAADIRMNIEVTLEEAAQGCRKKLNLVRGHPCVTCAGSGEAGMTRTRFCKSCHGSGRIRDPEKILIACPACVGRGFFSERICPDCAGSGRDHAAVLLEITVPPGMRYGDELRLAGQGEPGDSQRQPGDLYLTVLIANHALYQLRGRDLHYAMPVSALAMLAGGEIELPTPLGVLRHTLQAGTTEVREIRLPGRGYPGRGKQAAGDLVVTLHSVFPKALTARQRQALLQVHAELLEDSAVCLPELRAWQEANGLIND